MVVKYNNLQILVKMVKRSNILKNSILNIQKNIQLNMQQNNSIIPYKKPKTDIIIFQNK